MPDNMIQLLRAVAESKKHRWRGDFDTRLNQQSSELYLRDEIAAIYHRVFCDFEKPDDSRWYDPYHILFSTSFALRLVQASKDSIPRIELIIPAVLLHDVGYYAVPDKTQWSGEQSRIVHMQEGAARSARVLWECGNRLKPEDVEDIVGMIASTKKCVEKLVERRWEEIECVMGRPSDDVYKCMRNRVDYLKERIDEDFGLVDAL